MKAQWINVRIVVEKGITKEEFVCNECKNDLFNPCRKVVRFGDEPVLCDNTARKHFNRPIALLRTE